MYWLPKHSREGPGKIDVADRIGGRAVDRADGLSIREGQQEDPDDVIDMDPAHPLQAPGHRSATAADRCARAHLEDRSHDGKGPFGRSQNDPDADDGPPDTQLGDRFGGLLPLAADDPR